MTESQELVKDAPKFELMERGELVAYAYAMHASGARIDTDNAKLRELVITLANCAAGHGCDYCPINGGHGYIGETDMCESVHDCMRELGVDD